MFDRKFEVSITQSSHAPACTPEGSASQQPSSDSRIYGQLSRDETAGLLPRQRQSLNAACSHAGPCFHTLHEVSVAIVLLAIGLPAYLFWRKRAIKA
jgi:hypothetical protein